MRGVLAISIWLAMMSGAAADWSIDDSDKARPHAYLVAKPSLGVEAEVRLECRDAKPATSVVFSEDVTAFEMRWQFGAADKKWKRYVRPEITRGAPIALTPFSIETLGKARTFILELDSPRGQGLPTFRFYVRGVDKALAQLGCAATDEKQ